MALLDELSGFEFEDVMVDIFRELGYRDVRQAARIADEGRDIVMEEVVDGTRRGVVVECKHTDTVSRPVVQKLHSAIATFEYDGPKRGIVATTGRFTAPAEEYAERLRRRGDPYPIELIDGRDLRELADRVGMDLQNGRIEIVCERTLPPVDSVDRPQEPVRELFDEVENVDPTDLPTAHRTVTFEPVVVLAARTTATFETSVGVVHRVDETNSLVVHTDRSQPRVLDSEVSRLVADNLNQAVDLREGTFDGLFETIERKRFGRTESEYREWASDWLREYHTTTVRYTGDNNVTYTKTCRPGPSDVSVQSATPVYLPVVRQTTQLGEYSYPYEYYAAGGTHVSIENGIHRCVHCGTKNASIYTYCGNCGSVNCESHIRTERLEGTPVCTGCAVTGEFALSTKYFYDDHNRKQFRAEYEARSPYGKLKENRLLAAVALIVGLVAAVGGVVLLGALLLFVLTLVGLL